MSRETIYTCEAGDFTEFKYWTVVDIKPFVCFGIRSVLENDLCTIDSLHVKLSFEDLENIINELSSIRDGFNGVING